MLAQLKNKLHTPTGKYVVIGGIAYVIELLVIFIAQRLGASSVLAVALSFWIGLMVSFVLQKVVTFGDRRVAGRVLLPQIITFSLLVLFNFAFTLAVTRALAGVLPPTVTRTLAIGVTVCWNFYLYKTRIFKSIPVVPMD